MYSNSLKERINDNLMRRDGKSTNQWIYRKDYIFKHNLKPLIDELINATSFIKSNRLDERIYVILNDIMSIPRCNGCDVEVKFKRYQLGYADYCSVKCRANDKKWHTKMQEIMMSKYGVSHISKTKSERKKRSLEMKRNRKYMDYSNAPKRRKETIERLYGKDFNTG